MSTWKITFLLDHDETDPLTGAQMDAISALGGYDVDGEEVPTPASTGVRQPKVKPKPHPGVGFDGTDGPSVRRPMVDWA